MRYLCKFLPKVPGTSGNTQVLFATLLFYYYYLNFKLLGVETALFIITASLPSIHMALNKYDYMYMWNIKMVNSQKQRVEWGYHGQGEGKWRNIGKKVQNISDKRNKL